MFFMVPLFSGHAAKQVRAALDAAGITGRVAVIDNQRLARQLTDAGRAEIVVVEAGAALEPNAFGAVVASGLARFDDWQDRLAGWCRAIRAGGLVVLVDRGQATELSRRALCGGLSQVEQRAAGRVLVTSGRWQPWA